MKNREVLTEQSAAKLAFQSLTENERTLLTHGLLHFAEHARLRTLPEVSAEIIGKLDEEVPGFRDALTELDMRTEALLGYRGKSPDSKPEYSH